MTTSGRGHAAATIHDVARVAGVSRSTAARAVGGYGVVSESARERVQQAARELGYSANGLARSMITGRTNTLGAVVADMENVFFARAMRGFTDVARKEGFDVILANTDEQVEMERSALKVFLEKRVDGLMLSPASLVECDHIIAAHRTGPPMVLLDRPVPGLKIDTVQVDNIMTTRQIVEHLVEAGHRKIALVTGGSGGSADIDRDRLVATGEDRYLGYRQALEAAGIAFRPDYVRAGDFHRESARQETLALMDPRDRPTAVFATDSVIALGAFEAFQDLGLRIPDDVSLVSFDDDDWTTVVRPKLSVMVQPVYEMGALAAERLIARVRGKVVRPKNFVLATQWVPRDSVAPPAARSTGTAVAS